MSREGNSIIAVKSSRSDYKSKFFSGGGKPVRQVGEAHRDALVNDVNGVIRRFETSFRDFPLVPGVAIVELYGKALAKSHRPDKLFSTATCPIIGTLSLGKLLVSVTGVGLDRLKKKVERSLDTQVGLKNIAAIEKIYPYDIDIQKIDAELPYMIRLFNHHYGALDAEVSKNFEALLKSFPGSVRKKDVLGEYVIYELKGLTSGSPILDYIGLKSVLVDYGFGVEEFNTQATPVGVVNEDNFPFPEEGKVYPLVGIIDTGIDPLNAFMAPWIHDRWDALKGQVPDYTHGTMVASLVVNGRSLNNGDGRFPDVQSQIVDVAAIPANGNISSIDLMDIIQESVEKFPEVKVWNLSLGGSQPVDGVEYSELGHFLNLLHDKTGCLFVVAAGNYCESPLRSGSLDADIRGRDRISSPADSVRSLTVGSVAHKEHGRTLSKIGEPSPFSRCGPGPSFSQKPDVVHFGGNCDANFNYAQVGVLGIGGSGALVENIGTSFAAPIVSSLAASIWYDLEGKDDALVIASARLIKSLIVHGAVAKSELGQNSGKENYYGFGLPGAPANLLSCSDNEITYLFNSHVKNGLLFERDEFIVPSSLINEDGKFIGEIILTVVYSPSVDFQFPAEYCRANVDVSFGVMSEKGFSGKAPQVRMGDELVERALVESGFKWSPVKVHKKQYPRGTNAGEWRLRFEMVRRLEFTSDIDEVPVSVLITLRSLDKGSKVYEEAISKLAKSNWIYERLIGDFDIDVTEEVSI